VKIVALMVIVLGWVIALCSTQVPSTGAQLIVALAGFLLSAFGIIRMLNPIHNKNAIWKS
jgi:hypothetical protein